MVIKYLILLSALISQTVNPITSREASVWLKQKDNRNVPVIDAREKTDFDRGHLKGALNIDATSPQATGLLKEYMHHETLFIYCNTHRRAGRAIELLKEAGYTGTIFLMSDGITGWRENNLPVRKTPSVFNFRRR